MLHMYAACVLHTQYIHIACMLHTQKLAQCHTHSLQAYEEMYVVFVQCSMYAVHKLHISCKDVFRCVRPHVHVHVACAALSQILCM